MHKLFVTISCFLWLSSVACAGDGLVKLRSSFDVKTTLDRFESQLRSKGLTIFLRINHAEGAQKVGSQLRATEVLLFGNPKLGSQLMACNPQVGLDLPQKALAFEDSQGIVWLAYNAPSYLTEQHNLTGCEAAIQTLERGLSQFASAAASK
ncbi:MAG: DUF302 domain-containing protein [bacterium]|nr:DUF302 domain-containing protein [bacterium]